MIFITGATGSIGKELCRILAIDNVPARAMCRREEQLDQFKKTGLDAVIADFDNPESLRRGMQDCDSLFLLTPPTPEHTQRESLIIDVAVTSGVKHIVRISTADANLSSRLSYAGTHAEVDHYLRSKPVHWTILRPTGFMQNFIESGHAIAKGILPHLMGKGQLSYIDSRDIALVAKQTLTENGHAGAIYYLTGPASLTVKDVASQLTVALGHEVGDIDVTETDMRKTLKSFRLSDWHIGALIEQFAIGANGYEIDVTEEVKRLTGHAPRTFAQFAQDFKDQFLAH